MVKSLVFFILVFQAMTSYAGEKKVVAERKIASLDQATVTETIAGKMHIVRIDDTQRSVVCYAVRTDIAGAAVNPVLQCNRF